MAKGDFEKEYGAGKDFWARQQKTEAAQRLRDIAAKKAAEQDKKGGK